MTFGIVNEARYCLCGKLLIVCCSTIKAFELLLIVAHDIVDDMITWSLIRRYNIGAIT